MVSVVSIPQYDFVAEEISKTKECIVSCYFKPNQYTRSRIICLLFTNKDLTTGKIEWLENKDQHPEFWNHFLNITS